MTDREAIRAEAQRNANYNSATGKYARYCLALLAELEQAERERDEAAIWLQDCFFGEDDDAEEWNAQPLVEWLKRIFDWGDQAWHAAGKETERVDQANGRLYDAVTRADAAEARLAAVPALVEAARMVAERGYPRNLLRDALAAFSQAQEAGA